MQKIIQDRTPDRLKMPYALWTRQGVAEVIGQRFGIRVPVGTMRLYLSRWGFTPQKPLKKAYEQSPGAIRKWLDEDYPAIAQRAQAEGAEVHWGDKTGLRSDDVRGRGYAPAGKTLVLKLNAKRAGLSITVGRRCREAGVQPSMGTACDAYDNAMCESFFGTLGAELLSRANTL